MSLPELFAADDACAHARSNNTLFGSHILIPTNEWQRRIPIWTIAGLCVVPVRWLFHLVTLRSNIRWTVFCVSTLRSAVHNAPSSNQLQPEAGIPGEWCHLSRHAAAARSNQTINMPAPNDAEWKQEISSERVPVLSNSNGKPVKPVTFGTTALNRVIKIFFYFSCVKCH